MQVYTSNFSNIRVYILTEGGCGRGFGHITRCLSLYHGFREKGIEPVFFVNGDESVANLLCGLKYEVVDWLEQRDKIFSLIDKADIAIVDSYLADGGFYEILSKLVKVPVYIDDTKRIDYPRGVVLNGNIDAESLNYPRKRELKYLLGVKYVPLRKEFWEVPERVIRETVHKVMVTFGGSDKNGMTPKILKFLNESYPCVEKNVVVGRNFDKSVMEEIKKLADENTNLIFYPNVEQMKSIMLDADIAISAGGQTTYELARVGVPTIGIATADNQLGILRGWSEVEFIEYAGLWNRPDITEAIAHHFDSLMDPFIRSRKSSIGRKMVDGKGVMRIIRALFEELSYG